MAVSYDRLWKLLIDRKISKADLRKSSGIAPIAIQQIIAHNYTNETTLCSPLDELLKILLK